MSTTGPTTSSTPPPRSDLVHRIRQGEALFVGLVLLSGVGIGVTSFSPADGFRYWVAMVPLFGGVSAFLAWARARTRGESTGGALRAQAFHWLGVLGALELVFLMKSAGQIEYDALGLFALIALALATFLSGVYTDWRLCAVGVLLGAIVVAAAFIQQVIWVVLVPGFALLVVLLIAWRRRGRPPTSISDEP
jgi:hypothetical protein